MLFNLFSRATYFLQDFSFYLILLAATITITLIAIYSIFKSQHSPKTKKFFLSAIFSIFIFVFSITLAEAYFRYVYDASDGLGFLKVNKKWHERHVVHNNYFFRDRDFVSEKTPGTVRIGVLGDSITFGGGIKNVNDRFSNLLEVKLNQSGYKAEVYNLGKPGYDTEGEILEYQKVKHLGFDIIIWEYFLNDIQALEKSTGTPIISRNSKQGQLATWLSDRSFLFDFFYWRLSSRYDRTLKELRRADMDRYGDQEQLVRHKEQIATFLADLEKENKKVVVVIFPLLTLLGPNYPAQNIHQMMGEHFRANGAQVIDILEFLEGKNGRDLWASEFDSHPNKEVHKLVAEKIYERIKGLLQ